MAINLLQIIKGGSNRLTNFVEFGVTAIVTWLNWSRKNIFWNGTGTNESIFLRWRSGENIPSYTIFNIFSVSFYDLYQRFKVLSLKNHRIMIFSAVWHVYYRYFAVKNTKIHKRKHGIFFIISKSNLFPL